MTVANVGLPTAILFEASPQLQRSFVGQQAPLLEDILLASASALELCQVACCVWEERNHAGPVPPAYLRDQVRRFTGLDLDTVIHEAINRFGNPSSPVPPPPNVKGLVRLINSILAVCPIDEIERDAAVLGLEHVGHRCRTAFDALKAFVFRNDEELKGQLQLVGRKYAERTITREEAAILLGAQVTDAVFLLEQAGFARQVDAIVLSEEQRARKLEEIRADRLRREGRPEFRPDEVLRDVIASERIEGVDARQWLRRGPQ